MSLSTRVARIPSADKLAEQRSNPSYHTAIDNGCNRWNAQQADQMVRVRQQAREAAGFSQQAGLAVGGAIATVASSTFSAIRGVVEGVRSATVSGTTVSLKRSMSDSNLHLSKADTLLGQYPSDPPGQPAQLQLTTDYCKKCRGEPGRHSHTYGPDCVGMPRSVYFGPKGRPPRPGSANEAEPPIQITSTPPAQEQQRGSASLSQTQAAASAGTTPESWRLVSSESRSAPLQVQPRIESRALVEDRSQFDQLPPLKPGWKRVRSTQDPSEIYFWHAATGESTFDGSKALASPHFPLQEVAQPSTPPIRDAEPPKLSQDDLDRWLVEADGDEV